MPPFTAFLDANVLYPADLRSFLMFLAVPGIFRARWSDDVHEEWISNLILEYARKTTTDGVPQGAQKQEP